MYISQTQQNEEIVHLVGLDKGDYDRSCFQHQECGKFLQKDDVIMLNRCIIGKGLKLEACIAATKLDDNGMETCRVGFLAKDLLSFGFTKYEGRKGKVKLLIKDSSNRSYRAYSQSNNGAAEVILFQ